jgi:uncharacterized protein
MKRFLGLAAALLLAGCYEADHLPPPPDPALWVARGPHAAAVLFGSYHALPTRMEWEPKALQLALAHADEIWFETPLDPDSSEQLGLALARHARLPKGQTLWGRLSKAEAARVRQACARVELNPDKLAHLQPWLASFELGGEAGWRATGVDMNWGVERVLDAQAGPNTRRFGLETPAAHAAVLTATPPADQIAELDATADAILDGHAEDNARLIREWRYGDVAAIEKDATLGDAPGMYRRLVPDRNHRFAEAVARRLQGKGFIVVVVGAAHMVGPEGVPALLRARGIPVDGPLTH